MVLSASSIKAFVSNLFFLCIFLFFLLKTPASIQKEINWFKLKYILVGAVISILDVFGFYSKMGSGSVGKLAGLIGLTPNTFVLLVCSLGMIASIPFISYIVSLFLGIRIADEDKIGNFLTTSQFYRICFMVAFIGIFVECICSFNLEIRADEAFSFAMIQHGYGEIISLTAADVHPPLYYFILKLGIDLIGLFVHQLPVIYVSKLISIIPFFLVLLISATKVKKVWGEYVSGICALCLLGMSNLSSYGIEMRMYSWGVFFVFAAYIKFCDIISKNSLKNWMLFMASSLAAAYTHYFAGVSVAFLYLALLFYILRNDKKSIRLWLLASAVTVIGYLPWLGLFINQVKSVSKSYWIEPIGILTIVQYIKFMFGGMLYAIICGLCLIQLGKKIVHKSVPAENGMTVYIAVFVPIWTTLIGIFASLLIRPVFISRYTVPGLACLWLGMAAVIYYLNNGTEKIVWTVLIFMVSISTIFSSFCVEMMNGYQGKKAMDFFEENKGAIYITDELLVQEVLITMSGDQCYIWNKKTSKLFSDLFGQDKCGSINSSQEIVDLLERGDEVYFVDSKSGKVLNKILAEKNLDCSFLGNYQVESSVDFYKFSEK